MKVIWKCKLAVLYFCWRNLQFSLSGRWREHKGHGEFFVLSWENTIENLMLGFKRKNKKVLKLCVFLTDLWKEHEIPHHWPLVLGEKGNLI